MPCELITLYNIFQNISRGFAKFYNLYIKFLRFAALNASRSAASDDALKQKLDREFQRKSVVLKRQEAKLAEHLRASGLLPDNFRVRVDGFGGSVSQKAVWSVKKQLQSPGKYVKINAGDYIE